MVSCAVHPAYSGLLSGGLVRRGTYAVLVAALVAALVPVTLRLAFAAVLTAQTLRLTP